MESLNWLVRFGRVELIKLVIIRILWTKTPLGGYCLPTKLNQKQNKKVLTFLKI